MSAQIPIAKQKSDGRVFHINEVSKGIDEGFVCCRCELKLIPVKTAEGVPFDKQKCTYLTARVNSVFKNILRISNVSSSSLNEERGVNTLLSSSVPRSDQTSILFKEDFLKMYNEAELVPNSLQHSKAKGQSINAKKLRDYRSLFCFIVPRAGVEPACQ
ncbi:hypothetical protein BH11BAC1_BH11BAC1_10350 [soil metagenome]